jgi:hypothetical protein
MTCIASTRLVTTTRLVASTRLITSLTRLARLITATRLIATLTGLTRLVAATRLIATLTRLAWLVATLGTLYTLCIVGLIGFIATTGLITALRTIVVSAIVITGTITALLGSTSLKAGTKPFRAEATFIVMLLESRTGCCMYTGTG